MDPVSVGDENLPAAVENVGPEAMENAKAQMAVEPFVDAVERDERDEMNPVPAAGIFHCEICFVPIVFVSGPTV